MSRWVNPDVYYGIKAKIFTLTRKQLESIKSNLENTYNIVVDWHKIYGNPILLEQIFKTLQKISNIPESAILYQVEFPIHIMTIQFGCYGPDFPSIKEGHSLTEEKIVIK